MDQIGKENILDQIIRSQEEQKKAEINPKELTDFLLKDLSAREKEVLRSRYGLDGEKKQTLEEIGRRLNITRERVRQIENNAIVKAQQTSGWQEHLAGLASLVVKHINKHGYISSEEKILQEFIGEEAESQARNCLLFILERFLNEQVEPVEIVHTEKAWKIKDKELKHYELVVTGVKNVLMKKNEPLALVEIIKELEQEISEEQKAVVSELESWDAAVGACLEVSKHFKKNLFDKWGVADWRSVNPKRMRDKIYLVLLKDGQPLHYREITKRINEEAFDKKVAHPATVHNELILDKRFVLVGRGIYALAEWGYKPGVIADVIKDILEKADRPLGKKEIIDEVFKSRQVKEGSIGLTLADKEMFERLADGKYILRK